MNDNQVTTICRYFFVTIALGLFNFLGYLQDGDISRSVMYLDAGAVIGMLGVLGVHVAGPVKHP